MKPADVRVLIRGAGELASATAHHLYGQGFERILMLDRRFPKAVTSILTSVLWSSG